MLTIFTTPKPFHGHSALIQTNAIKSWAMLRPQCEIILFGNEKGTSEIAAELDIQHIPRVSCNESGLPFVSSMFEIAQDIASFKLICYANADIIFMNDFLSAISLVHLESFLLVGRRWNLDINETIDFNDTTWDEQLNSRLAKTGKLYRPWGIDYFVFNRGLYENIPPFVIGRPAWDNWMIYRARILKIPVIDATNVITAVHQSHVYAHHVTGTDGAWRGTEGIQNRKLLGGLERAFRTYNATLVLTPEGIKRALSVKHLYHRILAIPALVPHLAFLCLPLNLYYQCKMRFLTIFLANESIK